MLGWAGCGDCAGLGWVWRLCWAGLAAEMSLCCVCDVRRHWVSTLLININVIPATTSVRTTVMTSVQSGTAWLHSPASTSSSSWNESLDCALNINALRTNTGCRWVVLCCVWLIQDTCCCCCWLTALHCTHTHTHTHWLTTAVKHASPTETDISQQVI